METPSQPKTSGKAVKATAMPDLSDRFSTVLLGKAITAKRTGMKLRIVDVAAALSLSKQTIVKIEKGDDKVNFNNILKVMEFLGLNFMIRSDVLELHTDRVKNGDLDDEWF